MTTNRSFKATSLKRVVIAFLLLSGFATPAFTQSFSCPIGKNAACLDYNDKVCGFMGMCVDSDAACFRRGTCDLDGFVCKSDLDDLAKKAKSLATDYDGLKTCLMTAVSIEDAKRCGLLY
ncbi:hypothetical protein [Rhizobium mongolense]